MALTKEKKKELVKLYTKKLEESVALFIINPKGLNPNEVADLKKQLFDLNSSFNVVKNTLFRIALKNAKLDVPIDKGENAVLFANIEDFTRAAKILYDFMKDKEDMSFKVGLIEGKLIDASQFDQLANLPSRDELIAQLLNVMQSPITGFVQVLNGNLTSFMNVVNAIKEEKSK